MVADEEELGGRQVACLGHSIPTSLGVDSQVVILDDGYVPLSMVDETVRW
jgi:hypothetical protein